MGIPLPGRIAITRVTAVRIALPRVWTVGGILDVAGMRIAALRIRAQDFVARCRVDGETGREEREETCDANHAVLNEDRGVD